jgi:predicted phosphodiesterase
MAYSKGRAIEIAWTAKHIGIEATALQEGISEGSVKRAIRYARKFPELDSWTHDIEEYPAKPKKKRGNTHHHHIPFEEMEAIVKGEYEKQAKARSKSMRERVNAHLKKNAPPKDGGSIVGVIGDLHAPFDLDAYFFHCVKTFAHYKCDTIVFIGDVVDNHFSSYHETDPDGLGGGNELDQAIARLERWYDAFPEAHVITGNHDRLVSRKAHSSGIPSAWIRGYSDVLGVPDWKFSERVVIDGVQYIHGEGGTARTKHKKDLMSTVQGHLHAQCYTDWTVGANVRIFGMQVGCGIDHESYAMSYAKNFPKPAISCGVVFKGTQAFNVPMEL